MASRKDREVTLNRVSNSLIFMSLIVLLGFVLGALGSSRAHAGPGGFPGPGPGPGHGGGHGHGHGGGPWPGPGPGRGGLPGELAHRLIRPEGPAYDGTGCPAGGGGVQVAVSPDGQTMSVLFNNLQAQVIAPGGKPVADAKFCVVRVPVQVPPGYALNVYRADYRGFAYLAGKTSGRLVSTVQLSSVKHAVSAAKNFDPSDEPSDYLFTQELPPTPDNRLICGENRPSQVAIRVDLQLISQNTGGQQAMLTLDSIDGTTQADSGLHYALDWQPCPIKQK